MIQYLDTHNVHVCNQAVPAFCFGFAAGSDADEVGVACLEGKSGNAMALLCVATSACRDPHHVLCSPKSARPFSSAGGTRTTQDHSLDDAPGSDAHGGGHAALLQGDTKEGRSSYPNLCTRPHLLLCPLGGT